MQIGLVLGGGKNQQQQTAAFLRTKNSEFGGENRKFRKVRKTANIVKSKHVSVY